MKKSEQWMTIGELSRLTGVNAKSLRYYEKIGILHPVWIDPENAYRYYSFSQIILVYSIQYYVEAGVPLETLHDFIDPDTGNIHFREQIAWGMEETRRKIAKLEQFLQWSAFLCQEMSRCEQIRQSSGPVSCPLPEKHCLIHSAGGCVSQEKYSVLLKRLLLDLQKDGIRSGSEMGMLWRRSGKQYWPYVYVDVFPEDPGVKSDRRYFHLPAQHYLCTSLPFPEKGLPGYLFPNPAPDVILLAELFAADFDFRAPEYELRWHV